MHHVTFYGTATVGAKGQIVIPAEAREKMNITPGDKLFIIGGDQDCKILGVCAEESLQEITSALSARLETLRSALTPETNKG
ncbi:MAG TPA: AbrB/MazE/SpoVT family DNA-binding domain-containing protein [Candidatus Saccharimonadales bacterium]